MKTNVTPIIEKRSLDQLKPHPRQHTIFKQPTAEEIAQLAKLIRTNGLTSAVEILPDDTIICGHSRVLAARTLGWTEIDVWVRTDLVQQGDDAVVLRLMNDNRYRRQLSPLDQARCIKVAFDLEKKGKAPSADKGTLRDRIAETFQMSGRNLDRYLKVLGTPLAVQTAFDNQKLTLVDASRVAGLDADSQNAIGRALAVGEEPRTVLQQHFAKDTSWNRQPGNGTARFLRPLQQWSRTMKTRLSQVTSLQPYNRTVLQNAKGVIEALLQVDAKAPTTAKEPVAAAHQPADSPATIVPGEAGNSLAQVLELLVAAGQKSRPSKTTKTMPTKRKPKVDDETVSSIWRQNGPS